MITMRELNDLFPEIPRKTLRWWVIQGFIHFSETREDGRGITRLFSQEDVEKAKKFIENRVEIRELYRLNKS